MIEQTFQQTFGSPPEVVVRAPRAEAVVAAPGTPEVAQSRIAANIAPAPAVRSTRGNFLAPMMPPLLLLRSEETSGAT